MRPTEIILIVVCCGLWIIAMSRNRLGNKVTWIASGLGTITLTAHLLFEGERWQLYPVYMITAFLIAWIAIKPKPLL